MVWRLQCIVWERTEPGLGWTRVSVCAGERGSSDGWGECRAARVIRRPGGQCEERRHRSVPAKFSPSSPWLTSLALADLQTSEQTAAARLRWTMMMTVVLGSGM